MNLIDHVLHERYQEFGLDRHGIGRDWTSVLLTPQFVTSRHVVALIYPAGELRARLVVKVPRQPGDNKGVQREADMLRTLQSLHSGNVAGIPEVVAAVDVGDHTVLVETAVHGLQLDPDRVATDVADAQRAGNEFVALLPTTRPASANTDWYGRTVAQPLQALANLVPSEPEVASLVERTHQLLSPLRSVQLPAVFEHADLSHPNIFIQSDGSLQVVDWERSSIDGLPGHDLVFYLQYVGESAVKAFAREQQVEAFDAAFGPSGWALAPVRNELRRREVDPDLLPALVIATWARSAATLAYRLDGPQSRGQSEAQVRDAVVNDRDYWLWRHAVERGLP
ncbi:aminoglycoside phosphotransferase family protein [Arthrobacter sp. VKM Ac-2550]|uniref:aminoglycoside phosphotransferase family protein n=1 Tax=Crystallibacter permensis TaxID=1938888 RepID=UPI0022272C91|nr:aminoglycoside phosphotransferase family protein [Arthrobacter sp. VKM Ac-2550]